MVTTALRERMRAILRTRNSLVSGEICRDFPALPGVTQENAIDIASFLNRR